MEKKNQILNGLLQYDKDLLAKLRNIPFYIVDDMMGIGKTTAAINMVNNSKHKERYIYVVTYLDEIQRIINACNMRSFKEPETYGTKLNGLKQLLRDKENIVTTHSLFHLFDDEVIRLCRQEGYILILDEVTDILNIYELNKKDTYVLLNDYTHEDRYGFLIWDHDKDEDYIRTGRFSKEKKMCDCHSLIKYSDTLFEIFPIQIFLAFKEVYVLTYMFEGQIQKYYYDLFNIQYKYLHVVGHSINEYRFESGHSKIDKRRYNKLITIYDNNKYNLIGRNTYSLSKTWYSKNIKSRNNEIRKFLYNYFNNCLCSKSNDNMWTTFKTYRNYIKDKGYTKGFVPCNAKSTNKHGNKHNIAYMINMYMNPFIKNFFASDNIMIDEDKYALSSMLQFIWRSAIRNDEPITLYIPSSRMRNLLVSWMRSECT